MMVWLSMLGVMGTLDVPFRMFAFHHARVRPSPPGRFEAVQESPDETQPGSQQYVWVLRGKNHRHEPVFNE